MSAAPKTLYTRLSALQWVGLILAILIAGLGFILGIVQKVVLQELIFYTAATFALVIWTWNAYVAPHAKFGAEDSGDGPSGFALARAFVYRHRILIIALLVILGIFLIASAAVTGFFNWLNIVTFLVLCALLVFTVQVSQLFVDNRSAFIGLMVLITMFTVGSIFIEGFSSGQNIKSMLLFAAFLGLACVGQTLVALLGGLDLSIPFVIGASNVFLLYLIGLGMYSWVAILIVLLLGALIGV